MMRNYTILISLLICLIMASCSEQSPYRTTGVTIDISIRQVSAGIIHAEFVTDHDAYYYLGIAALDSGMAVPYDNESQFMDKVLNRAYSGYMDWRYKLSENGSPFIASFADHTLSYGKTEKFFVNLWPSTRYFVYAFVVDPVNISYFAPVFSTVVSTTSTSVIDASFDMTIDRDWDFVYPLNADGEIVSSLPYRVSFISKKEVLKYFDGDTFGYFNKPAWYFFFNELIDTVGTDSIYASNPELTNMGVSCRRHDGRTPEVIPFSENETYYASICSADGIFLEKAQTIYRFTWQGPETHIVLTHGKDDVGYHW